MKIFAHELELHHAEELWKFQYPLQYLYPGTTDQTLNVCVFASALLYSDKQSRSFISLSHGFKHEQKTTDTKKNNVFVDM